MRSVALLATRAVLGGYVAGHGAQKLFGSFGGPGIEGAGAFFDTLGLRPGRQMATVASVSELAGGFLTITGAASPLGPLAILGTAAVAATTHRKSGPFAADGGYELPLTNAVAAVLLAASGPGALRIPLGLPKTFHRLVLLGGAAMTVYSCSLLFRAEDPTPGAPVATAVDDAAAPDSVQPVVGADV